MTPDEISRHMHDEALDMFRERYHRSHALDRAHNRLILAGYSIPEAEHILARADAYARHCSPFESVAIRMSNVRMVGRAWSDSSNGDSVVAIIRNRTVATLMFRRLTQPFTPATLNVDRTVIL